MTQARRRLWPFLLALSVTLLAGCGGQTAMFAPLAGPPGPDEALPLRVSWVKQLQPEGREDLWRPMSYATPTVADGVVYLGDAQNIFYAFRATTGDELWRFTTYGPVESAPVAVGDAVIFGDGDGYVYCLNRKTGFAKWTYRVQGQVMGRLVSDGKLVFVRTNHERLYALTVADGKWKWMQSRELPTGFSIRGVASPVLDNGRVLAGFADGYLLAYNAADGAELFKTMLEKGERFVDVDATPAVDGGSIYVASYGGTLYCLSRENAAIQWTYRKSGVQRATFVGDRLFFSDADGLVHALDKRTGAEIWAFDVREFDEKRSLAKGPRRQLKVPTAPVPFHDVLVLASSSGYLYALDQRSGAVRWKYWPGFGATADVVADKAGNALYLYSNFGNLYRLKPSVLGAEK